MHDNKLKYSCKRSNKSISKEGIIMKGYTVEKSDTQPVSVTNYTDELDAKRKCNDEKIDSIKSDIIDIHDCLNHIIKRQTDFDAILDSVEKHITYEVNELRQQNQEIDARLKKAEKWIIVLLMITLALITLAAIAASTIHYIL